MRKMLFALFVIGLVASAGLRPAAAQSTLVTIVHIPFDFIVCGRVLPAGQYHLSAGIEDPTLLTIVNVRNRDIGLFVPTMWMNDLAPGDAGARIAFKNVRGHMFLWQITMPGGSGREIAVTSGDAMRTLAKLNLLTFDVGGNDVK